MPRISEIIDWVPGASISFEAYRVKQADYLAKGFEVVCDTVCPECCGGCPECASTDRMWIGLTKGFHDFYCVLLCLRCWSACEEVPVYEVGAAGQGD